MKRTIAFCACVAIATTASAAELGRLFFTPAERGQLDLARTQKKAPPAPPERQVAEVPGPEIVTYGGIVRRSDGKALLWINNRVAEEKEALGALSLKGAVRPDGAVSLHVPQSGAMVEVKVGQSVDLNSGRVAEGRKAPPEVKPPPREPKSEAIDSKTAGAASSANATNDPAEKKAQGERQQNPATPLEKERVTANEASKK